MSSSGAIGTKDVKAPTPADNSKLTTFHIAIPPASAAEDEQLIAHLCRIINEVYTVAEDGIFTPEYRRTNPAELKTFLLAQKLAIASRSATSPLSPPTNVVGCVRISRATDTMGNFGTLVAVPESRGTGLGRQLVDFAEDYCRGWGATVMQLELLVPMTFQHKLKVWVQAWYERLGYKVVRLEDFAHDYPALAPMLLDETEYRIFEKKL